MPFSANSTTPIQTPFASTFDGQGKEAQRQLNTMIAEFTRYKHVAEQQAKKLKTVVLALKVKDQMFKDERQKANSLLNDLASSIENQRNILEGRQRIEKSVSPNSQEKPHRAMSPYEKRLLSYQQSSLQRSTPSNDRPGSRNKRNSRERFSEKSCQNNTSGGVIRKTTTGFYADHNSGTSQRKVETDFKVIRTKLEQFLSGQEASSIAGRQRDRFEHELVKQLEIHLSQQLMYIG